MEKEGKYIYCIIGTGLERNFGPIGIGGRGDEVLTIGHDDLSMVVSNHPPTRPVVNSDNMQTHTKVIEEVMKEFDSVLPVRFGTIASDAEEIRNLLDRRYGEFKNLLGEMDHKVELGIKGFWKDTEVILKEVVEENKGIKEEKERLQNAKGRNIQALIEVGKMVEKALEEKKEREAERIVNALRRTAFDYKLNKTLGDRMFMNAAFLVDKGREKEFDSIMDNLSDGYGERIKFIYAGPFPPYNFASIVIYPEEWER